MFDVGEPVVYPNHGVGVVEGVAEKEVLGEKKKYYTLYFPHEQLKIEIPLGSLEDVGLRGVISSKEAQRILMLLAEGMSDMSEDWNKRFKENKAKIRSGDAFKVAEVVRNLSVRDVGVGLSAGEKRMLSRAREILAGELALVLDVDEKEVCSMMDRIFNCGGEVVPN